MSRKLVYHRKNVEQMFFLPTDTWYPAINRFYSCVTWLNIISVNKKILENILVVIDRAFLNKSVSTSHRARFFRQSIFLILIFHFWGPYTNIISVFIFYFFLHSFYKVEPLKMIFISPFGYILLNIIIYRSRPSDEGGWGVIMTLILGEGGLIKKFIQPLGPQLGLKISGGAGPPGSSPRSTTDND